MTYFTKFHVLPVCAVVLAVSLVQAATARCIDEENIEGRIGTGVEPVPNESQGLRMSLPELVKEAIQRSHAIGASKLLAEAAANDAEEARVAGYPQLSLGGNYGATGSSVAGESQPTGSQARGSLNLSMPLFDWGRNARFAEWRKQLAEAARLGQLSAEEQIGLQTVSLVLERGRYRVQVQVYQQYARKMSCLVQALETIVAADKGRASELVQARKNLQQAELSQTQTVSAVKQVEVRLRRFVGDALPASDAIPNGLLKLPALSELMNEADHSAEMAQLAAQARAGNSFARGVVAGQKAQVGFSVTASQTKGIGNANSWFTGVSVNVPLFNAGYDYSAMAARKRADAARLQHADALEARKFRMAEVYEQATSAFDRAQRVINVVRDSDRLRNFTLQQWQQLGRRSLFDVMGSESEHYNLRVAYVNALYDSQQSTAMLWSLGAGVLSRLQ